MEKVRVFIFYLKTEFVLYVFGVLVDSTGGDHIINNFSTMIQPPLEMLKREFSYYILGGHIRHLVKTVLIVLGYNIY